jgi:hypothetical protein
MLESLEENMKAVTGKAREIYVAKTGNKKILKIM